MPKKKKSPSALETLSKAHGRWSFEGKVANFYENFLIDCTMLIGVKSVKDLHQTLFNMEVHNRVKQTNAVAYRDLHTKDY